ncbi:hypothetical protein KM1_032860 [Entamoeba histolytica HM-3:IMSS]|uniref:Uncharacterized protein n=7 Tax=Entamoeba TaxID=5758 RepID=C4M8E2_ENTH1|nr:hypothetical protein ENU1_068600 [Entamoeba nuttalli P19]XP_649988.1 hypothetical protein EHI_115310 [Entamoeba histolytica HM-1:IMSS]EMD47183.1 Hypothetical protein EHI5A_028520 [Entamoeba histolytica KU27]EMS10913.1 hypothetical protein KM1_032860 [Entamoeba histolytica HM-3:IMSS]ENY65434.1 hypothetical protein EHI7A_016960 [Entamoeba histolytica HM-1:IMSS-A]GAT97865.1 hypothetical protein CL6EHI_115310 [Entamoeba histolytica]EAL44602.1 hypothetical protein EHI_115310 [Entamoeba histolyt|eukprot:XP_008856582.1 hypothetical protein ENU1_068600 [Entamoeba nuttalli P19]
MKITFILFLFVGAYSVESICETCQNELKTCLNDQIPAVDFIIGKKHAKTCQCCAKYDECIGTNECEYSPSICYKTGCKNLQLIGWIMVCVIIGILLIVIAGIYLFYRYRHEKKIEKKDDEKIITKKPLIETEMKTNLSTTAKHKDVEINYQKLHEVIESSFSSSDSSSSDEDTSKPLTQVQITK